MLRSGTPQFNRTHSIHTLWACLWMKVCQYIPRAEYQYLIATVAKALARFYKATYVDKKLLMTDSEVTLLEGVKNKIGMLFGGV